MAKSKPKIVTKKHLARLERERRQIRIITFSAIGIIAIIFLLIIYGILNQTVLLNFKPVVTVNGEEVSVREFQMRVRVRRQQLIDQYMQYYQFGLSFGINPLNDESLSATLNSIDQELNDSVGLGQQVLDSIIDEILIRQYAQKNGIVVAESEVQRAFQEGFRYFPEGTITSTPTSTPFAYSTLSNLQLTLVTATPTFTPSITPTVGPTRTPIPRTPFPTLTPISQESYQQQYQESVNFFRKYGMNEEKFWQVFGENPLYRQRVKALVTAELPHEEEQVWARHILVADEDTAKTIYSQLMEGADFAALAAENSLDSGTKDKGGDLGWFGRGKMIAEFENAAFSLKVGEISQPVQTIYGWHIIQVIGHEVRPLTESEYQQSVEKAFTAWLQVQRENATIVIADNWSDYVPKEPTLQEAFRNMYATYTAQAPTYEAQRQTLEAQYSTPTVELTPTP